MITPEKAEWAQSSWNAYVAQGSDRDDRKARLEQVPISMRENARRHVETIFSIKKYHRSASR